MFYNPSSSNDSGLEWIKVYNYGHWPLDLNGYELFADGSGYYTFPATAIPSQEFVTIYINKDGVDTSHELYTGSGRSNMSDSGGTLAIFKSPRSNQELVSFVSYGAGTKTWEPLANTLGYWISGQDVPLVAIGHSIKLDSINNDKNLAPRWLDNSLPNPGV